MRNVLKDLNFLLGNDNEKRTVKVKGLINPTVTEYAFHAVLTLKLNLKEDKSNIYADYIGAETINFAIYL